MSKWIVRTKGEYIYGVVANMIVADNEQEAILKFIKLNNITILGEVEDPFEVFALDDIKDGFEIAYY